MTMRIEVGTMAGKFVIVDDKVVERQISPQYLERIKAKFDGITHTKLRELGAFQMTDFPAIGEDGKPALIRDMTFRGYDLNDEDMDFQSTTTVLSDDTVEDVLVVVSPGFVVYTFNCNDEYISEVEESAVWTIKHGGWDDVKFYG